MDGCSWVNLMMDVAMIPNYSSTVETEPEIDINNLHQYLN